jgi:hypothetical protein
MSSQSKGPVNDSKLPDQDGTLPSNRTSEHAYTGWSDIGKGKVVVTFGNNGLPFGYVADKQDDDGWWESEGEIHMLDESKEPVAHYEVLFKGVRLNQMYVRGILIRGRYLTGTAWQWWCFWAITSCRCAWTCKDNTANSL